MENLNAEQIIKVLECCANWTVETGCKECPYNGECIDKDVMADALALIGYLTEKKKNLEYTLAGVMHSVDKWLDGAELEQDEVNRAITMRDKTLRLCETLDCMIDNLRDDIDELTAENERLRELATTKEIEKEIVRRETRAAAVKEIAERLRSLCVVDLMAITKEQALFCIDQIVKEMLEAEK